MKKETLKIKKIVKRIPVPKKPPMVEMKDLYSRKTKHKKRKSDE
jgi:hypothetical protein